MLVNLRDMFSSIGQGNFMDTYSIPPGIMIELWEKWLKEIYEPEVEKRRMSYGGKQLSYMDDMGDDINEFEWLKDCTLRSQENEKIKILNVTTQC